MVAFPFVGGIKIWFFHDTINEPETLESYGVLFDEIRTKTRSQTMFNVFAMFRRLIMILTITGIEQNPYFQIVIFTILSFLNLGYILVSKPFLTKW